MEKCIEGNVGFCKSHYLFSMCCLLQQGLRCVMLYLKTKATVYQDIALLTFHTGDILFYIF